MNSRSHRAESIEGRRAPARDEILIGKDILELISSAMYVEPLSVYREYVQNAADAVDAARAAGHLGADERGEVDIDVDEKTRTVKVRDNGSGIPWRTFARRLTALGASAKRGSGARGFRGIGRLAGIGYAQELIFRSRVNGEIMVSELRWDCRRLRSMLRDVGNEDLVDLIQQVVTITRTALPDYPDRFFEVEMKGVIRTRNDKLMSRDAVGRYLEQVAPVPFHEDFHYGAEIAEALRSHVALGKLEVRISGLEGALRRPHRDHFKLDETAATPFTSLEIVEAPAMDGGIAAVAWVLHHAYEGALSADGNAIKGLRVRSGNIQVGDHALLEDLFPEVRFNSWTVGEVHIVDRRIVPNGRRDHFEQNGHFNNLVNHLTPLAKSVATRCRTGSVRRKWLREFAVHEQVAAEKIGIIGQWSLGPAQRQANALAVEQTLLQMEKIAEMDLLAEDDPDGLRATGKRLRSGLADAMKDDQQKQSPLVRLPPKKRQMYEHLFELVYECSTNRSAAKALVDRILLKIA